MKQFKILLLTSMLTLFTTYANAVNMSPIISYLLSDTVTPQSEAIDKIMLYADDNIQPLPTVEDYADAGVVGVTLDNIDDVNSVVANLTASDVDTTVKIQKIVDDLEMNILPIADAGADQNVQVNQTVTITGTGTDSDGTIVSYEWTKGMSVLATTASFDYSPNTVGVDTLTLTVIDDDGATATDNMNVTVSLTDRTIKIMPLGDSITHEDYRDPTLQSTIPEANRTAYRDDLLIKLQGGGYQFSFEGSLISGSAFILPDDDHHQGTAGLLDSEMAANVYDYLTANPADIVLLHIGTNGVIIDNGADDVEATLNEIDRYETASGTHVKVILARIINCRPDWVHPDPTEDNICTKSTADGTTSDSITKFNNAVVTMAETRIANGDDIVIVDMENGAGLVYDDTHMIDDLHPNDAGYAKMADVWYDALVDNIPTHQWKLEETAAPYVDTYRDANGACGALSGVCPTKTTDGIIGSAQSFNGTDSSIDVTDDGTFDWATGDSFTVEFWMKPDNTTGLEVAVGRHEGTTGSASWWIGRDGNKIKFILDSSAIIISNNNITFDQWTHVTIIRDAINQETRLYINGEKDNSSITGTTPNSFDGEKPLNIGWFNDGFNFNGALDEMTIYNGVLNKDQIKQHYNAGTAGITLAITSTPVILAEVNTPYIYDVNSNDPSATYSVTDDKGWMEIIDPSAGIITNAVTLSTVGNTDVIATATNSSQTVDQNFTVKVRDTAFLPTGMEHYWKLNESTGATTYIDEYNGATDATCSAGCPTQVPGKVDEAQDFNGVNSDLSVPDNASFDWAAGDSFTIEFWMKANTLPNLTTVLLGRYTGPNVAWWIGINDGNAYMSFRDSSEVQVNLAGTVIESGSWYHIAAVRDTGSDEFKLYINGQETNSSSDTTTGNFNGTVPITMGYFIDAVTESQFNFDGILDEVAIFNRPLPANEIAAHHANGLAGNGLDNPVSFVSDVYPILYDNCFSCHKPPKGHTFQVDTAPTTYNNIIDNHLINTTSPELSSLLIKGNGGDHGGGAVLSADENTTVSVWIEQGGLNN